MSTTKLSTYMPTPTDSATLNEKLIKLSPALRTPKLLQCTTAKICGISTKGKIQYIFSINALFKLYITLNYLAVSLYYLKDNFSLAKYPPLGSRFHILGRQKIKFTC